MVDRVKDFLFGLIIFVACSFIGCSGFYALYLGFPMLYNELLSSFGNVIVQISLMIVPVIIGIICSGVYAYLLYGGLVILFACCVRNK